MRATTATAAGTAVSTIAAAKARLEARQADADRQRGRTPDDGRKGRGTKPFPREFGVPTDDAQDNFTDPESRIMKTSYGYDQGYNGQVIVEATTPIIVGTDLTACAADNRQLVPLLDQVTVTVGTPPHTAVADNGYVGEDHFVAVEARGITPYVSLWGEGKTSAATAPGPATARMAARLASDEGRAVYRRRKAIVESVIGWIKTRAGLPPIQRPRRGERPRRVDAGVLGRQPQTSAPAPGRVTPRGRLSPRSIRPPAPLFRRRPRASAPRRSVSSGQTSRISTPRDAPGFCRADS